MATNVTFNGTTYSIPGNREPRGWGASLAPFLIDVGNSALTASGGAFTLTAELDFGASYGIKSIYYKSRAAAPASAGQVRLGNTETVSWRNAADSADIDLSVDGSDELTYGGVKVPTISSADTLINKTLTSPTLTTPTLTSPVINTGVSGTGVLDEDTMSSDSATQLATQQSIKAYADTKVDVSQNPVFTSTGSMGLPAGTTAQRTGSPADGMVRYNSTLSRYEGYKNSAWSEIGGGGAGEINFIDNPDAEVDTTGWATYDDGPNAAPVDGVGGSSFHLTLTRQATTVLRGTNSFKLAKSTGDSEGEGLSYDFTIDSADKNKLLKISFDYNTDGTYTDGDIKVYIYDVTNSTLITPSDNGIIGVDKDDDSSGARTIGWASTDSTSYRLIFHITESTSDPYDLYLDNVIVGPGSVATGAVITAWEEYTPTTQGFGTIASVNMKWRRVGESIEVLGSFVSGTVTASEGQIGLPGSYTVDVPTSPLYVGEFKQDNGTTDANFLLLATDADAYVNISRYVDGGSSNQLTVSNGNITSSGVRTSVMFSVPVAELSGSGTVNLMSDNVVAANARVRYFVGTAAAVTGGDHIDFDSLSTLVTKVGNWSNDGDGVITVPSAGTYKVDFLVRDNGSWTAETGFYLNLGGVNQYNIAQVGGAASLWVQGSGTIDITDPATETITIEVDTSSNGTVADNDSRSWIQVTRVSDYSAGQPVGFGAATATQSGLLPPPTSMSNELATALGHKTYSHGTTYNGGNAPTITVGGATLSGVFDSTFIPYQTQDGEWRLRFNLALNNTGSTTNCGITVAGATAKNTTSFTQSITLIQARGSAVTTTSYILPNTSEFVCYSGSSNDEWSLSGDILLESKPNWAY